ncbi:MAG: sel1 repeat family protein [Acidobacteriota bacterium]|nr:sel1 repeat family protein [Acidobacteriota bacterium]
MRLALLMLVMLFVNCTQFKFPALPKVDEKKRITEAQTQRVIENLQKKPEWLFTGDDCPADIMPEIEKKIEYQAEGCAGDPDKCLEKCQADDANACYALSSLLDEQREKEAADTQALYLRACKLGISSGCTNNAAGKLNAAPDDEKTAKCAADTFEKTCSHDDSWGCTMYGTAWALGSGRPRNIDEAQKYLQKACIKFGDPSPACQSARKTEELIKNQKDNSSNVNKP